MQAEVSLGVQLHFATMSVLFRAASAPLVSLHRDLITIIGALIAAARVLGVAVTIRVVEAYLERVVTSELVVEVELTEEAADNRSHQHLHRLMSCLI